MTTNDSSRLTAAEVTEEVNRLRDLSQRAHDHGDTVLWMVLHTAAESVADGLEFHAEVQADDE
jgi:hypothetical protein